MCDSWDRSPTELFDEDGVDLRQKPSVGEALFEEPSRRPNPGDLMCPEDPIYLDHNATTPLLPEVVDAMLPYLREHFGNPSSGHAYGKRSRRALAEARSQVASLLGCADDEVVFTSGGTEANKGGLRSYARSERPSGSRMSR